MASTARSAFSSTPELVAQLAVNLETNGDHRTLLHLSLACKIWKELISQDVAKAKGSFKLWSTDLLNSSSSARQLTGAQRELVETLSITQHRNGPRGFLFPVVSLYPNISTLIITDARGDADLWAVPDGMSMPLLKTLSINCSAGSYTSVFLRAPDVLTLQPVFPNLNELEWNQEGSDLDWMAGNLDGIEQFSSVQTFRNRIRVVPSEQPIKERDMLKDIVIATKLKFKASEGGDRTVETNILVNKADWKEEAVYEQETGLANGMWLLDHSIFLLPLLTPLYATALVISVQLPPTKSSKEFVLPSKEELKMFVQGILDDEDVIRENKIGDTTSTQSASAQSFFTFDFICTNSTLSSTTLGEDHSDEDGNQSDVTFHWRSEVDQRMKQNITVIVKRE